MKIAPGEIVGGHYELIERVGEGGHGEVWRARTPDGAWVAVKFLHARVADDLARRFAREADILARLRNPHCVTFHEFDPGGDDHPAWLVTSFVEGMTLADWIDDSRTTDERLEVILQVAMALDAAHRTGVVHRDLKPANVIVSERRGRPHVTVIDFGIGKLLDEQRGDITATGEVIGTPGFMSPEQLRGRRDIGPPTDLYALGALIYQVFEQRAVFRGRNAFHISMQHLTEPIPPMTADVPASLEGLVVRLLAKDPNERPGLVAVLRALRPLSPPIVRDEPRRGWGWVVMLLGGVALLGVAVTMLFERSHEAPKPRPLPAALVETAQETTSSVAAGCPAAPTTRGWLSVEGGELYVPQEYTAQRHALVVLSVAKDRSERMRRDVAKLADETDRLLVAVVTSAEPKQNDEFIDTVAARACVDRDRVYLIGDSSASEQTARSQGFAATALIDHSLRGEALDRRQHGPSYPAAPLYLFTTRPAEESVDDGYLSQLRREHGCTERTEPTTSDYGECQTWTCDVELTRCTTEGASEQLAPQIWRFLSGHRRRTSHADALHADGCGRPREGRHVLGANVYYVPAGYDAAARYPVIFLLHGNGQLPADTVDAYDLERLADRYRYVIVAPLGVRRGSRRTWNTLPGPNARLAEAVAEARRTLCLDRSRTYVLGVRGAGNFAETLRRWGDFAAVATFSHRPSPQATEFQQHFEAQRPYLAILPLDDPGEPPEGVEDVVPLTRNEERLRLHHGCGPSAPEEASRAEGRSRCRRWTGCAAELEICEVEGWQWPHGPDVTAGEPIHHRALIDFFRRHRF